MVEPRDILVSIVFPGVVALLLLVIAWQPWRRKNFVTQGGWAAPLAIGFAVAFAYAALQKHVLIPVMDTNATRQALPPIPPADAKAWLMYLSLPVGFIGAVLAVARAKWWAQVPVGLLVIGGVLRMLMPRQDWPTVAMVTAIVWGVWVLLEPLATRAKGIIVPVSLWFSASAAAVILTDAGSQKLGLYAGAMSTVAGVVAVVALLGKDNVSLARGGTLAFVTLLAGLLVTGYFYAEVTTFQAIGVLAISLTAWVTQVRPIAKLAPWKRTAIGLIVVLTATAIVATPAVISLIKLAIRESTGGAGDEYNYY